jgi:protein SCO1
MTTPAPRSASLPIYLVLAVATALGLGLMAGQRWFAAPTAPTLQNGLAYPQPRPLPAFTLDGADGQPVDADTLRGRWTLLFIGFTHCPDVCPTTLAQLAAAERQLTRPERARILFVSVDPERDSAARTAEYARHFSPTALAATADHARLQAFTRPLGMVYMQSPLGDDGYTVDHSASVAVIDPSLRLVAQLRPPLDAALVAADLELLMDTYR